MQKQSISAFIDKTWTMLENNSFSHIVRWTEDGNSFRILDESSFQNEVLPIYFKHSNLTSFQRQVKLSLFSSICIISTRKKLSSVTPNTITDCSKDIRGNASIYSGSFSKLSEENPQTTKLKLGKSCLESLPWPTNRPTNMTNLTKVA